VFDTIQDGITVLDMDMNILKMNRAMESWYLPQKPYLGKKCYHTYHSRGSVCEGCPAQKAIATGKCQTKIVPRGGPAGTPGWIELSAFPIVNLDEHTIGAVEYVRNITARKTAEERLRNSEKKLKEIIDFLPDPTWVVDNEGIVIQWNHALEHLTNIPAEEIVGKGDYEYAIHLYGKKRPVLIDLVLEPDEKWEAKYSYLEKNGKILTNAESFHPSMGTQGVYLSGTASPLYDSDGETVGAIETVRDITEKKLLEQEKEKVIKDELDKALSNAKVLNGLLPICASCKQIRDDKGYWNQIENYIRDRSEAEFSHSLCPVCEEDLYGDQEWYKNK
ncbi:MAG: PAS domain-containing protein, partial [Bacteroidetes bacterium]|nr:PAS domain-containing protein [Bacteroidota bacterium]